MICAWLLSENIVSNDSRSYRELPGTRRNTISMDSTNESQEEYDDMEQRMIMLAVQAIDCALLMTECTFPSVMDGLTVRLKVGIGLGELQWMIVGGVNERFEFLLAGESLKQMSNAEQAASPNVVVVSGPCWELVFTEYVGDMITDRPGGLVRILSRRNKIASVPVQTIAVPVEDMESVDRCLTCFTPRPVLENLESGYDDWLSEIRNVSVMFLKLEVNLLSYRC